MDDTQTQPLDVVIPYHEKDAGIINLCVKSCLKFVDGVGKIFLISRGCPQDLKDPVIHIEEDKLFGECGLNKRYIEERWKSRNYKRLELSGWLFQQFIKLGCYKTLDGLSPNYLVIDSDVVWLKKTGFLNGNKALVSYSDEYYEPDYLCCEKLLCEKLQRKYSFIAHHMPMNKDILEELFCAIEKKHNKKWYDYVIDNFSNDNLRFSEYQLYGNYLMKNCSDRFNLRRLRYLQTFKLKYYPLIIMDWYNYIVFHSHKNPIINHDISQWKYNLFLKYAAKKVE